MPVNKINAPYSVPYPVSLPPTDPFSIKAVLKGPLITFPIPLPPASNPNTNPVSNDGLSRLICVNTPDQVELKPPAKKPYVMEKRVRRPVAALG